MRPELPGGRLGLDVERALRRILYGCYALVSVHFREEEVCLPILNAGLTPEEAREMFDAMQEAATEAKEASVAS